MVSDRKPVFDEENPEWTEEDFARAKPPEEILPSDILAQFKNTRTRGPQKAPKKVQISLRVDPTDLERLKKKGPGWQRLIAKFIRKELDREERQTERERKKKDAA